MELSGQTIKHYKIIRPIGKGGMGEVYLAQDTILDRKVAIKFLPEETQDDAETKGRFLREAKSAAALDHPFICKIFETGETDGKAYIAMEYVEGKNLRDKTEEEPLPLKDTLQIGLEIAEALEKAHKSGIVHRDLKPANIMLTPQGHVKVMDFGLAKRILPGGEEELSQTITQASITEQGTIAGTLAYMSPEQAKGDMIDGRSDIFSLGIILHEMISGKHPFSKTSVIETLSAILRDPHPPTNIKPKAVNPIINPILRKAMAKDTRERYQNIADLAVDLRNAQKDIMGGIRLLYRGLPILAASIVIIALLVFAIIRFIRPGATGMLEKGPEPISILIADFQNKTDDPVFDGALEHAITLGLEEASFITAYRRQRARALANQLDTSADGRLDVRLAKLVCVQEGINVVIDGSIEKNSKGYTFKVFAIDPFSSEEIAEASKSFSTRADVLNAAVWLANEVISDLGGVSIDSAKAISEETFTSSSIEAVNAYTRAQELNATGMQEEAIEEYLKAIEADPEFGRAYAGLAMIYFNRGDRQRAQDYHKKALARIDNMTDREKYRTRSIWYLITRDYQKAIEECSALVNQYPADSAGHGNLAYAYYMTRNMAKALEHNSKAVELFPKEVNARFNQSCYALGASDFVLAKQEAEKTLELDPKWEKAYVCLALSELAQDRPIQAGDNYEKLKTLSQWGFSLGTTGLADIALYQGRLRDAKRILEKGIEIDTENQRAGMAAYKKIMLAHTNLLLGEKNSAHLLAEQACAALEDVDVLVPAAQICLEAGKEAKASALAAKLNAQLESEPRAYGKLIEGEINRKRGEIHKAIELFQESRNFLDTWLVHLSLGKAFLEAEAFPKAHSEFEMCLKRRGEAAEAFLNDIPSYYYFPQVHYYLGRTLEGLGSPAAADSYEKFLQIKLKGDDDWMIEDACRRIKAL